MSRRVVLWIAFAVVHLGVAYLGFLMPNQPMGDVYNVYEPWSREALAGAGTIGITADWVYPQLAIVPMVLAHGLGWIDGYIVGWAILVMIVNGVAFAVLVGSGRSTGRTTAAWFWLSFIALLGPVGLYRLDGFTVPLAILGCLWLVGRPWLAGILLAVATWMKVWPAALLLAAVIVVRRRGALVGGAAVVSALTLGAIALAGGAAHAFGFLSEQGDRGLQVEAVVSAPYLWGALQGLDGFWVYWDPDIVTFQVTGAGIDPVIAAMTPILIVAITAVTLVGAWAALRGARFATLFPPLSLALVTALIVFNKVGSPQYLCWLVPSIVLGLVIDRRQWAAPASVALGAALLTQLVYPLLYNGILSPAVLPVAILTLRNLILVALFVWMLVRLVRVIRAPRRAEAGAHVLVR